jgi:hypothetical protein
MVLEVDCGRSSASDKRMSLRKTHTSSDRRNACRNKNPVSVPYTPTHLHSRFLLHLTPESTGRNMDSVASRFDPRSHKTQLVFTALAASALTAAAITSYNSYSRQKKRNELNKQVLNSVAGSSSSSERGGSGGGRKRRGTSPPRPEQIYLNGGAEYGGGEWNGNASSAAYDEDLIREQLARNYAFFGEEGMKKIRGASVAVIGCGGVGSWAAVMLARSYAHSLPKTVCEYF